MSMKHIPLKVEGKRIKIEAVSQRGVYWAMQTLAQLQKNGSGKATFSGCDVVDWPAFRVRGFMQDARA